MGGYYASFAGDGRHLGSAVVEARDEADALELMTESGLNPGGQVMVVRVIPGVYPLNCLLSADDMRSIDGSRKLRDLSEEERNETLEKLEGSAFIVCENCNPKSS